MPTNTFDFGQLGNQMGKTLAGLFGGENYRQGYEAELGRMGDLDAKRAQAGFNQAKTDTERQRMQFRTPQFGNQLAATLSGLVGDQPAQMEQFQRTGNWGTRNFIPSAFDAEDLGGMLGENKTVEDAPAWATPEKIGAYQQALGAHYMNLAGTGDSNAQQMAESYGRLRTQGGADRAMADSQFAPRFAMSQAAAAGKPLYDNAGGEAVFNQFTGGDIIRTKAEVEAMAPLLGDLFGGQQFRAEGDDASGWRLMPVSGETYLDDQGNPVAAPRKVSINTDYARALGIDEQRLAVLARMAEANPKYAAQVAQGIIRQALRPVGAEKLPARVQEFRAYQGMTPQEQQAYRQWSEANKPSTNVNVGAPSVTVKEAMKTQGKEFGKFASESMQSAQVAFDHAADVQMIVEGMRGMGGGPVAEFKAWAGRYLPADSDWGKVASMGEMAKTIQTKLAPTMRAAGSGATSDFEMKAYMAAIPTLSTTEMGRELMAKYMLRIAERAQVRAEIVNDIEQGGKLPTPKLVADEMRKRLPDRFFDDADRAHFGMKAQQRPTAAPALQTPPSLQRGQVRDGYRFKGGDPADPKNWEKLK